MNATLLKPISQQVVWKNDEVKTFAVALVERALNGPEAFTTDIVPDEFRGDGTGIAGSVVELLKNAHIIEPLGQTFRGEWFAKRVASIRPGRKSSYIGVYRLRSEVLAREFLVRNGGRVAARQAELQFA